MCPEAGTLALNVIRVTCDGAQDGSGDEDGDRPKSHGPLELRHIGGLTSGQKETRQMDADKCQSTGGLGKPFFNSCAL